MDELLTLDTIYFPDGLLDTRLGLYIWNGTRWIRTDKGHQYFDPNKKNIVYFHGMGGNGSLDRPEIYYDMGYNVMTFLWGTYACETVFTDIVNKIYYTGWGRWARDVDNDWEKYDVSDATVPEIFLAFYYELLSAFPNYSGSNVEFISFSYGGHLLGGINSLMVTAFQCGLLPAYMLPDTVTMLDPFMCRAISPYQEIAWLGDKTPENGNVIEAVYQGCLLGRKLGITYRVFRASDPVCMPAYLEAFDLDSEHHDNSTSYWNFIGQTLYTHLDSESSTYISRSNNYILSKYLSALHGFGEDWYLLYYQEGHYYDANATLTQEEVFGFDMPYDVSFARSGAKYTLYINETISDTSDDTITSGNMRTLTDIDEGNSIQNAKICGFVYVDLNNNQIMDERITEHFAGAVVTVTDENGTEIYKTTTKVNGYYEANVTLTGRYTVQISLPSGYSAQKTSETVEIIDPVFQCHITDFGITK